MSDSEKIYDEKELKNFRDDKLKEILEEMRDAPEGEYWEEVHFPDVIKHAKKRGRQVALNRLKNETGLSDAAKDILEHNEIYTGTLIRERLKGLDGVDSLLGADGSSLNEVDRYIIKNTYFPVYTMKELGKLGKTQPKEILDEMLHAPKGKGPKNHIRNIFNYQVFYPDVMLYATKRGIKCGKERALDRLKKENGFSVAAKDILRFSEIYTGEQIITELKNRDGVDSLRGEKDSSLDEEDKRIIKEKYFPTLIPLDDKVKPIISDLAKFLKELSSGSLEPKQRSDLLRVVAKVGLRLAYNFPTKVHEHAITRDLFPDDITPEINKETHGYDTIFNVGGTESKTELKNLTVDLTEKYPSINLDLPISKNSEKIRADWLEKIAGHGCLFILICDQKDGKIMRGYRISYWLLVAYLEAMLKTKVSEENAILEKGGSKIKNSVRCSYCNFCGHFHRLLEWEKYSNGVKKEENKEIFNKCVTSTRYNTATNRCHPPKLRTRTKSGDPDACYTKEEFDDLQDLNACYTKEEFDALQESFWN
ncbi:hypothetical protein BV898_08089 [Hypsibius exemplaris]|uniref:Uncharacterized protein n=1 Tax=Hypsibius exemplaris TaxID=2072580 RepID=A0A1W0WRF5_HYPEX|nr:hypothetical protein BV898_08089 [Hypsibius exemplaris]